MFEQKIERAGLGDIYEAVRDGKRLSFEQGVRLYSADLEVVGALANTVRERMNGDVAFYVRNQHINYTNVCNKFCRFCSFYAHKDGPKAYTLTMDDIRRKLESQLDSPISEVHIVGGIHPKLPYEYYFDLLHTVRETRPDAIIKAFTMIELQQIQLVSGKPMRDTLLDLMAAGLGSLPGGGVEVLSERLHEELFGKKLNGDEWLETAREAHQVGLKSNATMLYGHLERPEERIEHMVKLRELQDETGGFLTFIPLSFHPEHTELDYLPGPSGHDDLRNIAVGRLMLDNFPHIKSFWIMNTAAISQVALWYGADDIDGTIVEYEITRDAVTDTRQSLTRQELLDMITEAGRVPVERDTLYNVIRRHDDFDLNVLRAEDESPEKDGVADVLHVGGGDPGLPVR